MMKILGYILIVVIVIFSIFGFLILLEYLKYWKRLIVLRLRSRIDKSYFEDIYSSSEVSEND